MFVKLLIAGTMIFDVLICSAVGSSEMTCKMRKASQLADVI